MPRGGSTRARCTRHPALTKVKAARQTNSEPRITVRTIEADVEALSQAGLPNVHDVQLRGRLSKPPINEGRSRPRPLQRLVGLPKEYHPRQHFLKRPRSTRFQLGLRIRPRKPPHDYLCPRRRSCQLHPPRPLRCLGRTSSAFEGGAAAGEEQRPTMPSAEDGPGSLALTATWLPSDFLMPSE